MSSTDWMHGGAPLLPKVSPYCVPEKMMELKRRVRGAGWQLRHKRAAPGAEVPWHRVHFWPVKMVPVITCQELFAPLKPKKKRVVVHKGPKVVKAPVRDRKFAARFVVRCDYQRVFQSFKKFVFGAQAATGAVKAASADAATAPTTRTLFSRPLVPGAFPGDEDDEDAAADVGAQTESVAETEAQPSLLASVFTFGCKLLFGQRELKRAHEDIADVAGDAKRRRVGLDAQAPARAEARPAAGKAARHNTTGATAPTHNNLTATAAQRRACINAPKASLILCPPPSGSAPVAGNAKVVKALSMPPPPRPMAGRPTRKRADTPDPRVGTPPPVEPEASSAVSTPTSSPSTSRSSSPASSRSPSPSPSPARKEKSSKSKSSSSKSKSSSESKSSSSKLKTSSSKSKPSSSKSQSSSSDSKSSSSSKSSDSKSSSSDSKPSSSSKSSSSKSQSSSKSSSSSKSHSSSSQSYFRYTNKPISERSSLELASDPSTVSGSTAIALLPPNIRWSRDGGLVNPWDPRCPAAPDPRFPWAPASHEWAGARPAAIAPLPEAPEPPSFVRFDAAAGSSTDRGASPARARGGEFEGGEETEVESGGEETDDEE